MIEFINKRLEMNKWVYAFNANGAAGDRTMKNLLGGKGANLAEMCGLGLPVPPGFTVSTAACIDYYEHGEKISDEIKTIVSGTLNSTSKDVPIHHSSS